MAKRNENDEISPKIYLDRAIMREGYYPYTNYLSPTGYFYENSFEDDGSLPRVKGMAFGPLSTVRDAFTFLYHNDFDVAPINLEGFSAFLLGYRGYTFTVSLNVINRADEPSVQIGLHGEPITHIMRPETLLASIKGYIGSRRSDQDWYSCQGYDAHGVFASVVRTIKGKFEKYTDVYK